MYTGLAWTDSGDQCMGQGSTLKRRFYGQVLRGFQLNFFIIFIKYPPKVFFSNLCLKVFSGSARHGARGNLMGNLIFRDKFVLYFLVHLLDILR